MKKKKVTGIIQTYSRKARDSIMLVGEEFFNEVGLGQYMGDIFSCVDELIKNAVKANYKFVLILEKIAEKISQDEPGLSSEDLHRRMNEIIRDKMKYDSIAEEITSHEEVARTVRELLNEESVLIRIKNKVYQEKRELTDDEIGKIEKLSDLQKVRTEIERRKIHVRVVVEMDDAYIYVEVTNNAPIMEKDLNRIYEKRDEYRVYREEGREHEFYLNNLDTSDSGFGLGYATIDSFLANMKLDPYRAIQIIAASNTTVILSLPLDQLRAG
ncbi:MAG TPA: hypothetical protein VF857_08080 [Spirochaetota bacterium]